MKTIREHSFLHNEDGKICIHCNINFVEDKSSQLSFGFYPNKTFYITQNGKPVTTKEFDNCIEIVE